MFGEASHVRGLRAVRTNQWKYIQHAGGAREELYDLRGDPRESANLCARAAERCAALRQELAGWEARMQATARDLKLPPARAAVVDERTRERLRALGYTQ
jgi:arylsulfatase A-like enzyme